MFGTDSRGSGRADRPARIGTPGGRLIRRQRLRPVSSARAGSTPSAHPPPTDPAELVRVGERVWTLTRLFNAREGLDRGDDRLPSAFARPLDGGPADGRALDRGRFERLLDRYYAARGWSESGLPSRPLLERVGLADVVDDDTPVAAEPLRPAGPEKP